MWNKIPKARDGGWLRVIRAGTELISTKDTTEPPYKFTGCVR